MIANVAVRDTERLLNRERVRRFPSTLHGVTGRKLLLLDAALTLEELMVIELNPFLAGWLSCEAISPPWPGAGHFIQSLPSR
jgi:hypothetical protein